jgi:hypothetical protein
MGRFIEGLKHAFALGPAPKNETPLPDSLERLAQAVVRRKLEMPAMIMLETLTPLNFLAFQTALAVSPLLSTFLDVKDIDEAAKALEDRKTLRRLANRIEVLAKNPEFPK